MKRDVFNYEKACIVCGDLYKTNRIHTRTCNARCRYILHQVDLDIECFVKNVEYNIRLMNDMQIDKENQRYQKENKDLAYANHMKFISGYLNPQGKIVISIYSNHYESYIDIIIDCTYPIIGKRYKLKKKSLIAGTCFCSGSIY